MILYRDNTDVDGEGAKAGGVYSPWKDTTQQKEVRANQ